MTDIPLLNPFVIGGSVVIGLIALANWITLRKMKQLHAASNPTLGPAFATSQTFSAPPVVTLPETSLMPPAPRQKIYRVAGRNIAESDWSPEVLEQIRAEYFRPPAKKQYLVLVDVTMTCPGNKHEGTALMERIAFVAKTAKFAHLLSDAIPKTHAKMSCPECGKQAHLSGRSVSWEGSFENWDGAM